MEKQLQNIGLNSGTSNTEEANCANCNATLIGKYCAKCGQDSAETVIPLRAFLQQGIEDVLSFDFRYPRTLKELIYPGRLTSNYLNGQRIRYAPPLKFAFNASVILFVVVALTAPDSAKVTVNSEISEDLGYFAREYALILTVGQLFVLPIWASIVHMGFKKQKPLYLNHLIFALHFHTAVTLTFMLVAFTLFVLPLSIAAWIVMLMLLWIYGPYLILSFKNVYKESWTKTALFGVLSMITYVILLLVVSGTLSGLMLSIS